jgi:hypothetical protein
VDREPTPGELLAQAVDALPPADRTKVVGWLLTRAFRQEVMTPGRPPTIGSLSILAHEEMTSLFSRWTGRRGEHQVVPIRLPTEQHSLLRDWCQEHGFAMATVVRGLVERFLEERGLIQRGAPEDA